MIAARRDHAHAKAAARHTHIVEAKLLVIEATRVIQVGDVHVEMSHTHFGRDGFIEAVIFGQVGEERVNVEWFAPITGSAIGVTGVKTPVGIYNKNAVFGRFAIQFDVVAFGVIQVSGFGHHMIGGVTLPARGKEARHDARQFAAIGEENGKVIDCLLYTSRCV